MTKTETLIIAIVAGVAVLAIWAVVTSLPRFGASLKARWFATWKRLGEGRNAKKVAGAADRRDSLLAEIVKTAQANGVNLAVSASGSHPTTVTWSGGGTSKHYQGDFVRYKQAMNQPGADVLRTHNGNPPKTLAEFTIEELEDRLRELQSSK